MRIPAARIRELRTIGIRSSCIANAVVLEHPDEFVREVLEVIGVSVEKARK